MRIFLILGLEKSILWNLRNFYVEKYKKFFPGGNFWEKFKKVFNLEARKFHYLKYKNFFFEKKLENFLESYSRAQYKKVCPGKKFWRWCYCFTLIVVLYLKLQKKQSLYQRRNLLWSCIFVETWQFTRF